VNYEEGRQFLNTESRIQTGNHGAQDGVQRLLGQQ